MQSFAYVFCESCDVERSVNHKSFSVLNWMNSVTPPSPIISFLNGLGDGWFIAVIMRRHFLGIKNVVHLGQE